MTSWKACFSGVSENIVIYSLVLWVTEVDVELDVTDHTQHHNKQKNNPEN